MMVIIAYNNNDGNNSITRNKNRRLLFFFFFQNDKYVIRMTNMIYLGRCLLSLSYKMITVCPKLLVKSHEAIGYYDMFIPFFLPNLVHRELSIVGSCHEQLYYYSGRMEMAHAHFCSLYTQFWSYE